jgi:hypothetical protein
MYFYFSGPYGQGVTPLSEFGITMGTNLQSRRGSDMTLVNKAFAPPASRPTLSFAMVQQTLTMITQTRVRIPSALSTLDSSPSFDTTAATTPKDPVGEWCQHRHNNNLPQPHKDNNKINNNNNNDNIATEVNVWLCLNPVAPSYHHHHH